MTKLFEILVPTIYGDTLKPIKTRHHRKWDEQIRKIAGGLTIMTPAKGQWIYKGTLYAERVIPVRIICSTHQMNQIVELTLRHYRQKAVTHYSLSNECYITYNKDVLDKA